MNFLDIKFSELFLNKHGEKIFNGISLQIKNENPQKYSKDYVEIIFKIAFFNYIGILPKEINRLMKDLYNKDLIDADKILVTHQKSIDTIKEYFQSAVDNFV